VTLHRQKATKFILVAFLLPETPIFIDLLVCG